MGNLFSRGQSIADLKEAAYHELKYWNEWHELMAKEEAKASNA